MIVHIKFLFGILLVSVLMACSWTACASLPEDSQSAVILAYYGVGDESGSGNNITSEQFLAHVREMTEGHYNIIALPALIQALKKKQTLPPQTIAITFEGGFRSAYNNAMHVLIQKNIPFTIFFSSGNADEESGVHMNWAELKTLSRSNNVTLGLLPASYTKLSEDAEIKRQINKARQRYREEIGIEAAFFSYPFGVYSERYKAIIADSGFEAAFGSQSGAVSGSSDFYALPRFPMTEQYGDLERFRMVAQALPFPVTDIEPQSTYLDDPPVIGFSVSAALKPQLRSLNCYSSGAIQPNLEILDSRIELRFPFRQEHDRIRINCTLPGPYDALEDIQYWRWFGMLFVRAEEELEDISTRPPGELP